LRIAIIGPFAGPSLSAQFEFTGGAPLPAGYPGAPLMTVLAKALVDRGHDVAAISTDYPTPVAELEPFRAFRARRLTAYFCPQRPHSFRSSEGRHGRALDLFRCERDWLSAAIADYAPDVIHAHWTYEFAWAALDSGIPTVVTAHDSPRKVVRFMPSLYRIARYLMARRVMPRCTHLTAVSPDLAADVRRLTSTPVTVVANPIANAIRDGAGCSPQAFSGKTLMMVLNGWNDLKNGAIALRAFARARSIDPALKLVCFGAGYEPRGNAQRWAQRRGFADGVEFRGPVPHDTVLRQMRESAALVHPSRWEACCMSIAEAMSVGLPVIAGRHTDGVSWQLDDGRAGVLADVTKVDDISRAMITQTRDERAWREMSTTARARARQLFNVDQVVGQYVALYHAALDSAATESVSRAVHP